MRTRLGTQATEDVKTYILEIKNMRVNMRTQIAHLQKVTLQINSPIQTHQKQTAQNTPTTGPTTLSRADFTAKFAHTNAQETRTSKERKCSAKRETAFEIRSAAQGIPKESLGILKNPLGSLGILKESLEAFRRNP